VPVGPGCSRQQDIRGVGNPLGRLLEEMAREPLLEVDHPEAVDDRPRGVAIDEAPDAQVADVESDPEDDLEAEVPPATRENPASCCDDSSHSPILISAVEVTNHPPMYDISTLGKELVSAVRSSEYRSVRRLQMPRMSAASSSSPAPSRSGARRSWPFSAKRHV